MRTLGTGLRAVRDGRKVTLVTAGVIGGVALLGASPVQADVTLLSLIDPPGQSGTLYHLDFTATGPTTTISIGGYQQLTYEYVYYASVTFGSGANLLGDAWTFTPAASGSDAKTQNDGTGVPALWFGGTSEGYYDTFSQTFATTPNDTYLLTFDFTNYSITGLSALLDFSSSFSSSALLVTTSASPAAVPEPSTWVMTLLGCVGFGLAGFRQARKAQLLRVRELLLSLSQRAVSH